MDTLSRAPPPAVPAYLLDLLRPLHQLVPLGDCSSVATHPKAGVRASAKTKTRDRRFRGLGRNRRHFRRSSMTHKVVAPQRGRGHCTHPLHDPGVPCSAAAAMGTLPGDGRGFRAVRRHVLGNVPTSGCGRAFSFQRLPGFFWVPEAGRR